VRLKRLWEASAARPPSGGMKDFFLSFSISQGWHNAINQLLLPTDFSAFFLFNVDIFRYPSLLLFLLIS
jgi:hypothetical protein